MSKSTNSRASRTALAKPKKPYAEFPLTPHASGKWMKKIRGQLHYFGAWARRLEGVLIPVEGDGWKDALEEYKKVADDLHAGRTPRVTADGLTVKDLCNHFLSAKQQKVTDGEMTSMLFWDYKVITDLLVNSFGKNRAVDDLAADDFAALRAAMSKKWGPVRLANSITRTRSVFKFGYEMRLMERPVRYGPGFDKPSASVLRRHKVKQPVKLLEAADIRALLEAADVSMRAMILVGVNCGFGNADCAELSTSAVNLEAGRIDFPRPKTGIARRCLLWPETVAAIRAAEAVRPKPAKPRDVGRVFLSEAGTMLVTRSEKGHTKDLVGTHFTNLLVKLKLYRKQIGFYTLRHVFETVAGGAKDQVAVDLIMGHADGSMASHYREGIEDSRLRAVVNHVRAWLWPKPEQAVTANG
jgi:integrase